MGNVKETLLPGVGVRYDFTTASGHRIGVIVHHAGHRELLVYDDRDPDRCREHVRIDEGDAHTLAEMLGAAQVQHNVDTIAQTVEGVTIDWLPVPDGSPLAGRTIGDVDLRQRTGVSLVAIIRGGATIPAPGPDAVLHAGDTAVVTGEPAAVSRAFALFNDT